MSWLNVALHGFALVGIVSMGAMAVAGFFLYRDRLQEERELAEFRYDLEFRDDPAEFEKVWDSPKEKERK